MADGVTFLVKLCLGILLSRGTFTTLFSTEASPHLLPYGNSWLPSEGATSEREAVSKMEATMSFIT